MTDQQYQNKIRAAQLRAEKLRAIELLLDGTRTKHLEGEMRLRAARFVRKLYERVLKPNGEMSLEEITSYLEKSPGIALGLKLHRWMLKKDETEVTLDLIAYYRDRPEPQKKTRVYLSLVAALADLCEENRDDAMIAFVDQTGLWDRLSIRTDGSRSDDLDPRLRLADLIRHQAAHIADRFDLAGLFGRAERLQAGWNPDVGPEAILLHDALQPISAENTFAGAWEVDALPALPSALLASIPFGQVTDANFMLSQLDAEATGPGRSSDDAIHRTGTATAFWNLHLAISPQAADGVRPCFVRTTSLMVTLDDTDTGGVEEFNVLPHKEALSGLCFDWRYACKVQHGGEHVIFFDQQTTERFYQAFDKGTAYREVRRPGIDEVSPDDGLPFARIEPVTPRSIQDWLIDDLKYDAAEVRTIPELWVPPDGSNATPTWFITPSLARSLEIAVRDDALQSRFTDWITRYEISLTALEESRRKEMEAADLDLRARWRAEREQAQREKDAT